LRQSETAASPAAAPTGQALFRAKALEQMASPDRIDLAPRVVRPATWVALAALALVLLGGLAGSALIRVPVEVPAAGLLLPEAEPIQITPEQPAIFAAYLVQPGDEVAKGQPLARLASGSVVQAAAAGVVLSLDRTPGEQLAAGTPVAILLPTGGPLAAVVYMRPALAHDVVPGMPARLYIESGVAVQLRGHVVSVGVRPAPVQAIARRVHNPDIAQTLVRNGASIEVHVALDEAPPPGLANLLCQASITVRSRTVFNMIMPGFGGG
jgi:biotin carboxyl carrier protein